MLSVSPPTAFGNKKRWKGLPAPSFSAHVRFGEHGAPVQGFSFVLFREFCPMKKLILAMCVIRE
jgi:hypothetical protein